MAHILVAGRLHAAGIDRLNAQAEHSFEVIEEVSVESYAPRMAGADAVVLRTQPMTASIIAASPRLRIVSRHGVGYDAVDVKTLTTAAFRSPSSAMSIRGPWPNTRSC